MTTEFISKELDHDNGQTSGSESTLSELSTPLTTNSPETLEGYPEVGATEKTPSQKWHILDTLSHANEAELIDELIDFENCPPESINAPSTPPPETSTEPPTETSTEVSITFQTTQSTESDTLKATDFEQEEGETEEKRIKENLNQTEVANLNTLSEETSSVTVPKTNDVSWTPEEICTILVILLADGYVSPSSIAGKSRKEVNKKINELKIVAERQLHVKQEDLEVYGDWSNFEISTLIYLWNIDLTARRLALEIPEKSGLEVRGKLLQLNGSVRWTDPELALVKEAVRCNQRLSETARELPIRTIQLVKSKISYYRNKSAREQKKSTVQWLNQQLLSLKQLAAEDLTLTAIKKKIPGISVENIASKLKELGVEETEITKGELSALKELVVRGMPLNKIRDEFPLRNLEILEKHINALSEDMASSFENNEYQINTITEKPEIEIRRKNFKNSIDELVYYAQWFASENFSGSGRGSRRRKTLKIQDELNDLSKEATSIKPKPKIKRELTEEEIEARNIKKQRINEKRQAELELRKQQRLEVERRRQERIAMGLYKPNPLKAIKSLKSEAEYFQSVTGNHQEVKEGETRHRRKTEMFIPEFSVSKKSESRHKLKLRQKQLLKAKMKEELAAKKKEIKRKKALAQAKLSKKKGSRKGTKVTPEPEEDDEQEEEEEEIKISAFDPYDINTDTQIPLFGRMFYRKEIISDKALPDLTFNSGTSMSSSDGLIIPLCDNSAIDVITSFHKNYNDLPISFPPFSINDGNTSHINPANKISVRHLLYPDHCETYVLAEPKSNELDPVVEIQKLFQIHYALYFLYSPKIKDIIVNDYCRMLDEYVENNDFSSFLAVIDKWNSLMLKITPNSNRVVLKVDINADIRKYAEYDHITVTEDDLKLEIFMEEISFIEEPKSPEFEHGPPCLKQETELLNVPLDPEKIESIENELSQIDITKESMNNTSNDLEEASTVGNYTSTDHLEFNSTLKANSNLSDYTRGFYRKLRIQKSVSRFCMQQILLRIYSRFVSPESNGLRSYKAFTAEVYGELLPSFVSEVLTKVDLRPSQKFYDLGSGVGNTTFQAALEFGAALSGGCELMEHASRLTLLQDQALKKYLQLFGLNQPKISWVLSQSFVENSEVREKIIDCDVIIVNNYLFDENLNAEVGRLLFGVKPGTKIISLRNFIRPRYRSSGDLTVFDYLKVERHEMSDFLSVSWTANKVPYYISTVQDGICNEYLR